jgi:hypothetical protein
MSVKNKRVASTISTHILPSSQTLDAWNIKRNTQLFFTENWNNRGEKMVLQLLQKMDIISAFKYHLPGKTN